MHPNKEIDLIQIFISILKTLYRRKNFILFFFLLAGFYGIYVSYSLKNSYENTSLCRNNLKDSNLLKKSTNIFQKNLNKDDLYMLNVDAKTLSTITSINLECINSPNILIKINGTDSNAIFITKNAILDYFEKSLKNELDFEIKKIKNLVDEVNQNLKKQDVLYEKILSSLSSNDKVVIVQGSAKNNEHFELYERGEYYRSELVKLETEGAIGIIMNSNVNRPIQISRILKIMFLYLFASVIISSILIMLFEFIHILIKESKNKTLPN